MSPEARRVWKYVERRFQQSGRMEWPTVRQVARALQMRQADVEQAADDSDGSVFLTYFNTTWTPKPGDWFVETLEAGA